MFMRRAGRTLIATLLCGSLAALTASSMALAQTRGNSGLPAGSGNPMGTLDAQMAQLQQQISALSALGQDVNALKAQMALLSTLQGQVDTLSSQVATLSAYVAHGGGAADSRLAVYDALEQKVGDVVGVQENIPWVSINVNNRTVVLQVLPRQLVGQFLWYGRRNCVAGPAGDEQVYISGMTLGKGANVFALAAVHPLEGLMYAAEPGTAPVQASVSSVLDANGRCTSSAAFFQNVVPATPVMNLNAAFQQPFAVR
jgi:hypothetical protein